MSNKTTFEQNLARIEEISAILSSKTCTLTESLELYEEAGELLARCRKLLNSAEIKLVEINNSVAALREEE